MIYRVYFEDTDAMGIVYHANYLRFCERARSEAFFRAGLAGRLERGASGGGFVLARCECDFIASARLGDRIRVRTRLLQLRRASCWLEQKIYLHERANTDATAVSANFTTPSVATAVSVPSAAAISPDREPLELFVAKILLAHTNPAGQASPICEQLKEFLKTNFSDF